MSKVSVICDINTKLFFNQDEAVAFLGFGSKDFFRESRKNKKLKYKYLAGKYIYTKKHLLDFVEALDEAPAEVEPAF